MTAVDRRQPDVPIQNQPANTTRAMTASRHRIAVAVPAAPSRGVATRLAAAWVFLAWVLVLAVQPASAQATGAGEMDVSPTILYAHTLENQPAVGALPLVYPLLSDRGTVELKPKENTLVVRDLEANTRRIAKVLSDYDHPRRPVMVEVQLVRATVEPFSPAQVSEEVPKRLLARLQDLLPYHSYQLLAGTRLHSLEGEQVSYRLNTRYSVEFRIGTLLEDRRVRLHGFQLRGQDGSEKALIHTNLNLHLNQTLYLGLATSEASQEALMVVITAAADQDPKSSVRRGGGN